MLARFIRMVVMRALRALTNATAAAGAPAVTAPGLPPMLAQPLRIGRVPRCAFYWESLQASKAPWQNGQTATRQPSGAIKEITGT
jgi:hypothetical protein